MVGVVVAHGVDHVGPDHPGRTVDRGGIAEKRVQVLDAGLRRAGRAPDADDAVRRLDGVAVADAERLVRRLERELVPAVREPLVAVVEPLECEGEFWVRCGHGARSHDRGIERLLRELAVLEAWTRAVEAPGSLVLVAALADLGLLDLIGAERPGADGRGAAARYLPSAGRDGDGGRGCERAHHQADDERKAERRRAVLAGDHHVVLPCRCGAGGPLCVRAPRGRCLMKAWEEPSPRPLVPGQRARKLSISGVERTLRDQASLPIRPTKRPHGDGPQGSCQVARWQGPTRVSACGAIRSGHGDQEHHSRLASVDARQER